MEIVDIYKFNNVIRKELVQNYIYHNDVDIWNNFQYTSNIYPELQYSVIDYSPHINLATYTLKYRDDDNFRDDAESISRFFNIIQSNPYVFKNMSIKTYLRIVVNINGYRTNHPIVYSKCIVPVIRFNYANIETYDCIIDGDL